MGIADITLPKDLANRLKEQLGPEFQAFQQALVDEPPVSIRTNPLKPTNQFVENDRVPWSSQGRYLVTRPRFTDDPLFHAGTYYVQEASSMFLEHVIQEVVDLREDIRVLDLSAAPGGKSTHLQSLLSRDSLLVANEIIASRNKILIQNLSRWGGDNHMVTRSDPKHFHKLAEFFDVILVDAPCSGEGLIRKDPGAIKAWSSDNVAMCARRQKRILADVVPALAPGGVLIYSTCTFSEVENESNLEWLIHQSGLEPLSIHYPDDWGIVSSGPQRSGYRFYPHHTRGEGFFITALRKTGTPQHRPRRSGRNQRWAGAASPNERSWLIDPDRYTYVTRQEHRIAIPRSLYADYLQISQTLRLTSSGLYLGKVYQDALKPSPELALSRALSRAVPAIELHREAALDYLAHQLSTQGHAYPPGYQLATHQGFGLGWLHVLRTGQVRNKYPSAWRILNRHGNRLG